MSELKPCPFCPPDKSDVSIYEIQRFSFSRQRPQRYGIECKGCGTMMEGPEMWGFETKEGAVNAWNTRYERTCTPIYEEQIVDFGKFDSYTCDVCSECFAMFGCVEPSFCPRCGSKVVSA